MTAQYTPDQFIDAAAREVFLVFALKAYEILHPTGGNQFLMNWHIEAMCYRFEKVARGETLRLIVEVPPRHMKSICASVALTAWLLGKNPTTKILVASYGADLAERHSRDTRTLMNSDFYKRLFPGTRLNRDSALEIETTEGGYRKAISRAGAVTGFGADVIIIDDLMKASDATSCQERQNVHDFFENSLVTRLNNLETGRIVIVQQRLADYDLVGYVKEKNTFEVLSLPAIAENAEDIPLGQGRVHRREKGDLLFPRYQSQIALDRLCVEMGRAQFSAQYQQDPTPPGGNRIRWEWFGSYDFAPERSLFQYVVQSWDTGHSEEPSSSYSVGMTWGFKDSRWHLLDLARVRLSYPDLKRTALRLAGQWRPDIVLIENASSGCSLIQELRIQHHCWGQVIAITPKIDKIDRLEAATAELETGKFLLPANAHWCEEFKRECMSFPYGRHDDQVDSLSQFVRWQKLNRSRVAAEYVMVGRTRRRRLRPKK